MVLEDFRRFWAKAPDDLEKEMKEKLMLDLFRSQLSVEKRRRLEEMYNVTNNRNVSPAKKVEEVDATIGEFATDMEPKDDPWAMELLDLWGYRYGTLWQRYVIAMENVETQYNLGKGKTLLPLEKLRIQFRYLAESRMMPKGKLTLFAAFGKFDHVPEHWAILQSAFMGHPPGASNSTLFPTSNLPTNNSSIRKPDTAPVRDSAGK